MDDIAQISQMIREVVGLTILRFVGSPISKEGEERNEAKLRKILGEARQFLRELERKYPKS